MPDGRTLSDQDRAKLDGIVQKMIENKESESDIQFVVDDFKNKYSVKKKDLSVPVTPPVKNTASPSVLAGGTSGLAATASGLPPMPGQVDPTTFQPKIQNTATLSQPTNKPIDVSDVKGEFKWDPSQASASNYTETALGNRTPLSSSDKNITVDTYSGQSLGGNQRVYEEAVTKNQDQELKNLVDYHDKVFMAKPGNKSSIDFYMSYLQDHNPEEFQYVNEKMKKLTDNYANDRVTGEDAEDTSEDALDLQRFQGELMQKALELKTKAYSGKYQIAKNNVNNYFKDSVNEFNSLNKNVNSLASQFEQLNAQLDKFPKNEQGQIVTDATNRKEVESIIEKQQDLYEKIKTDEDRINELKSNKDFMDATSLLDDVQNKYSDLSESYLQIARKDPEAFRNLPEYKKLLETKQSAKKVADIQDQAGITDFGVGESVGRSLTNFVSKLAYIPKSLTDNAEYGWTDRMYDTVKDNIDDFNDEYIATPTEMDKPILENGKWNLKYLPGKVAGTATDMGLMMLPMLATEGAMAGQIARGSITGELASSVSQVVSGYVMTASDYYNEAKAAGMGEKEAVSFSRSLALQQGLLELVAPNKDLFKPSALKKDIGKYADMVANGATKKEAVLETMKSIVNKNVKEITQEELQMLDEVANKYMSNELAKVNDNSRQSIGEQMIETAIVTALTTSAVSGKSSMVNRSQMNDEALFMAASAPEKMQEAVTRMLEVGSIAEDKANEVMNRVAKANEALQKIDTNLPQEMKIKILPSQMEKLALEEKKNTVDSSFKDSVQEEIDKKEDEIRKEAGLPSLEEEKGAEGKEKSASKKSTSDTKAPEPYVEKEEEELSRLKELNSELGLNEEEQARYDELVKKHTAQDTPVVEQTEKPTKNEEAEKTDETEVLTNIPEVTELESTTDTPIAENKNPGDSTQEAMDSSDKKKSVVTNELLDEEEEQDKLVKDDPKLLEKFDTDIEIAKKVANFAAKYNGINSRLDTAVAEGRISKRQANQYKSILNQIKKGKEDKIKESAKAAGKRIGEIVEKAKTLGIDKGVVEKGKEMSQKGLVDVQAMIDLAADYIGRALAKQIDIEIAIDKAINLVKKHPTYKNLVTYQEIDDASFEKTVRDQFQQEYKPEKPTEEEAQDADIKYDVRGEKRKNSIGKRFMKNADKHKAVAERLKKEGVTYESTNRAKATEAIDKVIAEYEKENVLVDLADMIINGNSGLPVEITGLAAAKVINRLEVLAEQQDNEFVKDTLNNKAGDLAVWWKNAATQAGAFNGVANEEISKNLPTSKAGLKRYAAKEIEAVQDQGMKESQKQSVVEVTQDINELMKDPKFKEEVDKMLEEERKKIAEKSKGKEWVNKFTGFIKSLKVDVSDC